MANIKFQNALQGKAQNCPPIWFMRQAGRYHSHYQALRAKHSFEDLCKKPELAAEVALGPVQDFDFDVAILFSDILFPLEGLGMGLEYTDKGPQLGFQLSEDNFAKLRSSEQGVDFMQFQAHAMKATRALIPQDKSLIGFVGGIWTLFVYAVEGGHAGNLLRSKNQPQLWSKFIERMLPLIQGNIQLQLSSGAEVVMIFDTAAGEVSPAFFKKYIQPVLQQLANKFPGKLGYYSKGTQPAFFTSEFIQLPWAGRGVDHRWDLPQLLQQHQQGFLQGNFDQAFLHASPADFKTYLNQWLKPFVDMPVAQRKGWVCGLGHGVLPKTPEENVRQFVRSVREALS